MLIDNKQLCSKISSDVEIKNSFGFDLKSLMLFNENGIRIRF